MKKIIAVLAFSLIFSVVNCSDKAYGWENQDINKGLNAKIENLSFEMSTYTDIILEKVKSLYKEGGSQKNWKSQISFQIDKDGKIYNKNYVIKDGYWINREVEYTMMNLEQIVPPPKEYKQEVIFITFEHVYPNTKIYFSNVKED